MRSDPYRDLIALCSLLLWALFNYVQCTLYIGYWEKESIRYSEAAESVTGAGRPARDPQRSALIVNICSSWADRSSAERSVSSPIIRWSSSSRQWGHRDTWHDRCTAHCSPFSTTHSLRCALLCCSECLCALKALSVNKCRTSHRFANASSKS